MTRSVPTIPLKTFREIGRNLLAKTKAGEVNWSRNTTTGVNPHDTTYEVVLPESRIVLVYGVPRAAPDTISLQLQNLDGLVVDSWTVDEPDWGTPEGPEDLEVADPDGNWRLLYSLFSEVHRRMTKWDKVVVDVEKALTSRGIIGESKK